jgi:hypothetical protein
LEEERARKKREEEIEGGGGKVDILSLNVEATVDEYRRVVPVASELVVNCKFELLALTMKFVDWPCITSLWPITFPYTSVAISLEVYCVATFIWNVNKT